MLLCLCLAATAAPAPAAGKRGLKAARVAERPSGAMAAKQRGLKTAREVERPRAVRSGDPDHDGLTTVVERRLETDPGKFDSDGDGFGDGAEVSAGTDPRRSAIAPAGPPATWPGSAADAAVDGSSVRPHAAATGTAGDASPVPSAPAPSPPAAPPPPAPGPPAPPPVTTIDSGPSGSTTETSASFSFHASESGASFQCKLDAGSWAGCSSPQTYGPLSIGAHTFSVRATAGATATRTWTVAEPAVPVDCTTELQVGDDVVGAIESAPGGAVVCLQGGSYPRISLDGVHKSPPVTLRSGDEGRASVGGIALTDPGGLQFAALDITGGITATPSGSDIAFLDDDITGVAGIYLFGDYRIGKLIEGVRIEGNTIHDIDYGGTQQTGYGYGIEGVGEVRGVTIHDNTIKSTASDYIQSATPISWVVDGNTFLGPSLLADHEDHQDLWQIFGGGEDVTFTDNVARNTETQESLLFQEGEFADVAVENNLFDHDSRGYTCQIYQSAGLVFRDNTIVGSHWGCLFRDLAASAPGSGYEIDHNLFVGTEANSDVSTEGRAAGWGVYDYNVSSDGSADGPHSVRDWQPSWADLLDYQPLGLPFTAGYLP
jgi:hypothetical protein